MLNILAFAGSVRTASSNEKLVLAAKKTLARFDCHVTHIRLSDFEMPIFDGDVEASTGIPENARKLGHLIQEADGIFIASPEYNGSLTPLLKNTIDWTSRIRLQPKLGFDPYKDKIIALGSATPGALGGIRGLNHLRDIFSVLGALVIAEQVTVPSSNTAFADDDTIIAERAAAMLDAACRSLVGKVSALRHH